MFLILSFFPLFDGPLFWSLVLTRLAKKLQYFMLQVLLQHLILVLVNQKILILLDGNLPLSPHQVPIFLQLLKGNWYALFVLHLFHAYVFLLSGKYDNILAKVWDDWRWGYGRNLTKLYKYVYLYKRETCSFLFFWKLPY